MSKDKQIDLVPLAWLGRSSVSMRIYATPASAREEAMPKTEIAKPSSAPATRPRDLFEDMRHEMDRVFERFQSGWPRWPSVFRQDFGAQLMVPDLDVCENAESITIEADLPGVDEKDVSVTLANGVLTI